MQNASKAAAAQSALRVIHIENQKLATVVGKLGKMRAELTLIRELCQTLGKQKRLAGNRTAVWVVFWEMGYLRCQPPPVLMYCPDGVRSIAFCPASTSTFDKLVPLLLAIF